MNDPRALRQKAARIREIAGRSRRRTRPGAQRYLFQLADRFDQEARRIERARAGIDTGAAAVTLPALLPSVEPGPLVGYAGP